MNKHIGVRHNMVMKILTSKLGQYSVYTIWYQYCINRYLSYGKYLKIPYLQIK